MSLPQKPKIFLTLLTAVVIAALLLSMPASTSFARGAAEADPNCKPGQTPPCTPPAPVSGGPASSGPETPAAGSKNDTQPPHSDPLGVTTLGQAAPGSKGDPGPAASNPLLPASITTASQALTCGTSSRISSWTTTSSAWQVVTSCTIDVPETGWVYLNATSSLGLSVDRTPYEARFSLSVDNPGTGDNRTDRWVNIYTDSADGTDKSMADSLLVNVSPGAHTFYLLAARYAGSGTVQLYNPDLAVIYGPDSATDIQICSVVGNDTWNTTAASFQAIRQCTLDIQGSGTVYVAGTASSGLKNSPYEARYRVGIDSTSGLAASDRWVNVYTDTGDGTDESVATQVGQTISAGLHTFYFLGTRYNGAGDLQIYDPTLVVIYIRQTSTSASICTSGGSNTYTNDSTNYTEIRSCTFDMPVPGLVVVDASASGGLNATTAGSDWEGQFEIFLDGQSSNTTQFRRWLNVYTDGGDGTDRILATSGLVNITTPGQHTISWQGKRYNGAGTMRLYSAGLTVFTPNYGYPTTTTLTTAPNPSVFGQTVALTATVTTNAGLPPSGQVVFSSDATPVVTVTLNVSGTAVTQLSGLTVGLHALTASYLGQDTLLGSASTVISQTVNKASTSLSLVSSPNPIIVGQTATFTTTVTPVSPGAGAISGSVEFYEGASLLGSGPVDGNSQATFSTSSLANGQHTLTIKYLGSDSFSPAQKDFQVTVGYISHVVYNNDFSSTPGNEWCRTNTSATPAGGRKFLGQFGNQTVCLSLSNLLPHQSILVSFDLFVIRSWNGDTLVGPDRFGLEVDGQNLINTSFSNQDGKQQSYPNPFNRSLYPAYTNASEIKTLGYSFNGQAMDAVYHISILIPHNRNFVNLDFSGINLPDISTASWGLDNVQVIEYSNQQQIFLPLVSH